MNRQEGNRLRSVHLSIVAVLTVAVFSAVPSALEFKWRENWMLPFLFAGVAACWVLHIRQLFSQRIRLWFFAGVTWALVVFSGAHPTSLLSFSVVAALEFALFSQADEKLILHVGFAIHLILIAYFLHQYKTGVVGPLDELTQRQLIMHAATAIIIYLVGINIIDKRAQDRERDEQVIRELTATRKRTEDFMANVSHELRTPVNVVTGLSSILEKRLKNEQDRQDASHILAAGKRLSDHVEDILDYTEIETGRVMVAEEPYTVASVVNDMLNALNVYTRTDLPQVIVDVDADIPRKLKGDIRRIKKILLHITDNAVKFTKRGGVYINIYRMIQPYGINLCIDVTDTGIGMSREALERLREGIYQADAERNRENTGFGLGLQIVYGLVHAMNGFVRIDSTEGEGTRVHVSLPQRIAETGRCMEVRDPERLKLAFYQKPEKFEVPAVRTYYMKMIGHVIDSFSLTLRRVSTLPDLKQMLAAGSFTHLFIADEEYGEDPGYFDRLCEELHVVVVAKNTFRPQRASGVTILRKPLYAFPLVEVLNAESAEDAKAVLNIEEEVNFEGIRALVVDDEAMNLVVAHGIFTGYGMIVETAGSGQEAIDRVKETDYDVIFMDHMMPVMDGVEAAHRIRDVLQTAGRRTRIIALTANAVSGAREMFAREGFDGFVAKPIERQELERTLRSVMKKTGGGWLKPAPDKGFRRGDELPDETMA